MSGSLRARLVRRIRTLPERHGKRVVIALCAIVALGFGARAYRATVDPVKNPGIDAVTYGGIARNIYEDQRFGQDTRAATDWSPGAPILYAGTYYLTGGEHPTAARLLVALMGALTILVVYLLARRIAEAVKPGSGAAAGLLAAAMVAVYPYFVFDAGRLMSEPLGALALSSAMLFFLWAWDNRRRGPWVWALPGVCLGLTAMARPEYLTFALVFGVIAAVSVWRHRGPRPGLAAGALLVAAFMLPVLPWLVRDYVVLDRFVPISTGGGKALYIGTYLPGDGNHFKTKLKLWHRTHPDSNLPDEEILKKDAAPLLDKIAAQYPHLSRDAALARLGRENFFRFVSKDPLGYAGMLGRKTVREWTPSGRSMHPPAATAYHFILLGLGLIGLLWLAVLRRFEGLVLGVVIVGITVTGAFLLAGTRRNVVLMPLVITLASCTLAWTWALIRERRAPDEVSESSNGHGRPADIALPGRREEIPA